MVQKRPEMVSWEDLEAVLAVSRAGSVRLAAASLGIAHTTLSRRVSDAERALGVIAYIRGTKGYTLTAAGQVIVDHAQRMVLEVRSLQREIYGLDHAAIGHVRISLPLPILTHLFNDHLVDFKEKYPRITLEFQTGYGLSDLNQYESDVAIRFQNSPDNDLVGTRVGTSFEAAYAVEDMLTSLHADNMKPVPIIAWGDIGEMKRRASRLGFDNIEISCICEDVMGQVELVKAAQGVGILPCIVANQDETLIRVDVGVPQKAQDIWVLKHGNLRASERIRVVSSFFADILRSNIHRFTP